MKKIKTTARLPQGGPEAGGARGLPGLHLPEEPVARGIALSNLALRRKRKGRLCEAYALACRGLALLRVHIPDHPQLQTCANTLAQVSQLLGRRA